MKKYRVEFCFTNGRSYSNRIDVNNFDELHNELSMLLTPNNIACLPGPNGALYVNTNEVTHIVVTEVED